MRDETKWCNAHGETSQQSLTTVTSMNCDNRPTGAPHGGEGAFARAVSPRHPCYSAHGEGAGNGDQQKWVGKCYLPFLLWANHI